ncbi:MAG: enoyl-CoA hydratase [Variibacter sp.]|jgi:enoyl-CoA hydratase|nr:enoyl-CoA hydratase [Variibacter sp.]
MSATAGTSTEEILFERRGVAGIVTLNRPHALNAVTHTMVRRLASKLAEWASDAAITRIIVRAAGERAFSAGGDIRALYDLGRGRKYAEALKFWREEYVLNNVIKHYPKPYISLIEGIVMGGGVGMSVHGSHRIAGDRYQFAMPEVGIGFFPDVGATHFLPRMPGELGAYCALTGERLKASDAIAAGLATHYVPSVRWRELLEELTSATPVDAVLYRFAQPLAAGVMSGRLDAIDDLFVGETVEEIVDGLNREAIAHNQDSGFAGATAALMRAKSPTSLKIALRQVRLGKQMSFAECMRTEFRIVSRIVRGHDFYEGVRAAIIDKDQAPVWHPATLKAVSDELIDAHFAPLPEGELELP